MDAEKYLVSGKGNGKPEQGFKSFKHFFSVRGRVRWMLHHRAETLPNWKFRSECDDALPRAQQVVYENSVSGDGRHGGTLQGWTSLADSNQSRGMLNMPMREDLHLIDCTC